jgi:hypothetical protein
VQIKLFSVISGDIAGTYTLDFEGDVSLNNIADIIQKAKRKYTLPGKQFTVLVGGQVFHVFKTEKAWKAYQLEENEHEQH